MSFILWLFIYELWIVKVGLSVGWFDNILWNHFIQLHDPMSPPPTIQPIDPWWHPSPFLWPSVTQPYQSQPISIRYRSPIFQSCPLHHPFVPIVQWIDEMCKCIRIVFNTTKRVWTIDNRHSTIDGLSKQWNENGIRRNLSSIRWNYREWFSLVEDEN